MKGKTVQVLEAPAIAGLRFREFAGESDYPEMAPMLVEAFEGEADYWTVEALRTMDAEVPWVDPARDRLIAEVDGRMIGAGRVQCGRSAQGERVYYNSFNMLPAWRGRGIGTAVLKHNERRLREIAAAHPNDGPRFFQSFSIPQKQVAVERLLLRWGYKPARYFQEMGRSSMEAIPDCPLPPGLEIRPIGPSSLRAIWEANTEAFRDHWCSIPPAEAAFQAWCDNPHWRRDHSAVAWDGQQCVGMVLGFVSEAENRKQNRSRIWTESICVRRPWRNRGVARALIAQCLRLGRDAGFKEAALGVDVESLSGALRLYESMGYQAVKRSTIFRKPMEDAHSA